MGNYIDYSDVQAATDKLVLERLTDELSPGASDVEIVNNRIAKREATFEGYASRQYPDLTALRTAKPEQAQLWIVAMVRYDLYGRRAVPDHVKEEYLLALQQLEIFARTGIPALIVTPPVTVNGSEITTNMTEDDLALMPGESENIKSLWKDMP